MKKRFLPYTLDQQMLLPPNMRDWLPEGHLAFFILDVVHSLDLSAIYAVYNNKDARGRLAFDPIMMVSLLVYAYCTGIFSSRKIEKATYDNVAFRVLTAEQHPDHDSIATFRKIHLVALGAMFLQILQLCTKAGLVRLGRIAFDGSKVQANASKHKAMSYDRMTEKEKLLKQEITELLEKSQQQDDDEDSKYGKGIRGDELPAELARRESRLRKIQEAKAALEAEARESAKKKAELALAAQKKPNARKDSKAGAPCPEDAVPEAKAQRNFTDPESRIMPSSSHKGSFMQGYNVQIAVDDKAQIIVATGTTQQANDKQQLVPMAKKVIENCGHLAEVNLADAGYFSESAVTDSIFEGVEVLVPPGREKALLQPPATADSVDKGKSVKKEASEKKAMRAKLTNPENKANYRMRKAIVEPVFGQIKEIRNFRRFSFRGLSAATLEFDFVAATHNLLKLFRSGKMATA